MFWYIFFSFCSATSILWCWLPLPRLVVYICFLKWQGKLLLLLCTARVLDQQTNWKILRVQYWASCILVLIVANNLSISLFCLISLKDGNAWEYTAKWILSCCGNISSLPFLEPVFLLQIFLEHVFLYFSWVISAFLCCISSEAFIFVFILNQF